MTDPAPLKAEALFAVVPEWVIFHPDLTGNDVRLYAVLARYTDSVTGRCFPGQTLLAQKAHMSERGVRDAVDRLEGVGALTTRRRWKDERGTIFYSSGRGRTQTSSEYVLRVTAATAQGVAATGAGTWRQQVPPNENQGSTSRRQVLPAPSTDRETQDRMALRGKYKPFTPPAGAVWDDEANSWMVDGQPVGAQA